MTNGKTKSLGFVVWRVLKNPLCSDLTYEEAAEYALEYIRLLGAPLAYNDRIETLDLTCYKTELPCDLLHIRGVRYSDCGFDGDDGVALRYASDLYHLDQTNNIDGDNYITYSNDRYGKSFKEYTYTVQKGILFASEEDGKIQVSYKAISLDEDGYPLLPDDEKVIMGAEYYILHRYLEPLWMMGKITDKAFSYIDQKKCWYMGSANASLQMVSSDQMETMMNGINRIIRSSTTHQTFFKKYGQKEYLKQYR